MRKTPFFFAKATLLAAALLFLTAGTSLAQRHGRGGHVSGNHGGGHVNVYHGGGHVSAAHASHGGWGGGYHNAGWGGYRHGSWGGWRLGWGLGSYPYYRSYWGGYYPTYGAYYSPYVYAPSYYTEPYYYNSEPYNYYAEPYTYPDTPGSTYADNPLSYAAQPAQPMDNTGAVNVTLPDPNAQVWFNDQPTNQTGTLRQFATPPLVPGHVYSYDVRATWMVNGQPVTQSREVRVTPGQTSTVDFRQ
jgi:uncharacterized protein (TIGR03000 family)